MKRTSFLGWLKYDITNRGITAWILAALLLGFYTILYFGSQLHQIEWHSSTTWLFLGLALGILFSALYIAKYEEVKELKVGAVFLRIGLISALTYILIYLAKRDGLNLFGFRLAGDLPFGIAVGIAVIAFVYGVVRILAYKRFFPTVFRMILLLGFVYAIPWTFKWAGIHYDLLQRFSQKTLGLPGKWLFYGLLYTIAITLGGIYVIVKYRHNKYQIVRTSVVIFVQATFAFSIPWILKVFEKPDYYFSYIWPLKVDYFYPSTIAYQLKAGLPVPVVVYSFVAGLIIAPALGYFFGKRWYCSWVCGCGGLANTAGDPFRHLSSKTTFSWKIEKITIHTVLILTVLLTILALLSPLLTPSSGLVKAGQDFRLVYGIVISSVLSGVVGVGLYPIGGTRIWCRFACPMAALLGVVQKFGRFRIQVKEDMCISCGLCSKYCEMGIDVRSYAQRNESFTRAACVGCGLCAEECPRGVLRLENVTSEEYNF